MKPFPLSVGRIHFVGIGGIGMSGIAELLHNLGYRVQGTDIAANANVRRLREFGIDVCIGHDPAHLGDAAVVVVSSAVKPDNPELAAARARSIPIVQRAEMLAEIMRLKSSIAVGGTHGKTTTTSIVAAILDAAGLDPTVVNGGIINAYGTNARRGEGAWIVVEADESDGSFTRLPATVAVVTNIDPEHLDHYGSFDALRRAFASFVSNIPFYGFAALCIDHLECRRLIDAVSDRRLVTYGLGAGAGYRVFNRSSIRGRERFDVAVASRAGGAGLTIRGFELPMMGAHNVQNALAAIAVAVEMGIAEDDIRGALAAFGGVRRRFTLTGCVRGVSVIDDYAHHPVEIAATLAAARLTARGAVIAVVQPHRYSRLASLFEEFCGCFDAADRVIVADVYAAGETPIDGADRDSLVAGLRAGGHHRVEPLDGPDGLAALLAGSCRPGDIIVCMGAGNITGWAAALPRELETLYAATPRGRAGIGR